jgi:hypothetical protein
MLAPKIDERDHAKILEELEELVSQCVPELQNEKDDAGSALLQIFAYMANHVVTRLNKVPDKNVTAFLNMLGTKLLPAQPARVPVKFYSSEGTLEDVLVPSGTQVATSETDEHPAVVFETEKTMNVTISQLKAVYSVDPDKDQIFDHIPDLNSGKKSKLFFNPPSQQHALYLGHEYLFNLKEGKIKLKLDSGVEDFSSDSIMWEYWGYDPQKGEGNWSPLKKPQKTGNEGYITLMPDSGPTKLIIDDPKVVDQDYRELVNEIKKTEGGKDAFWIRARLKNNSSTDFPVIEPLRDCILSSISAEVEISVRPDLVFYNDTPIDMSKAFYPFGTQPCTHDAFYIGSQEGFSKKNAKISITFYLDSAGDPEKSVGGNLLLSWEYWNGSGWSQLEDWDEGEQIKIGRVELPSSWSEKVYIGNLPPSASQPKIVNNPPADNLFTGPFYVDRVVVVQPQVTTKKISEYRFDSSPTGIEFRCPQDIMPTEINGKKNYWIRVRIVGGNYGIQRLDENAQEIAACVPPKINTVTIADKYLDAAGNPEPQSLQYCLAKNNLQFSDCTGLESFKPFEPPDDRNQAVYLGFDKSFANGRISIFFSLMRQEYLENKKPRITWSYLRTRNNKDEWVPLQVLDTTDNLTISGTVEFLGPSDIDKAKKFGQALYWIRAEVAEYAFQPYEQILSDFIDKSITKAQKENIPLKQTISQPLLKLALTLLASTAISATQGTIPQPVTNLSSAQASLAKADIRKLIPLISVGPCVSEDFSHPKFAVLKEVKAIPAAPEIEGVYLNTTWAVQAETVTDELLGSSDGKAGQTFFLSGSPALFEVVWTREPTVPDKDLLEGKEEDVNVTDKGEVWVKWRAVDDFFESNEQSRHYTVDRTFGQIQFGNGVNGMIPPIGGTIKASYKTGGGTVGNVAAGEVKNLLTSIAFIDGVHNPDAAQGGANTESVERVLEKGPKRLQHRHRAVAQEDYEWLAKEASRAVARAKCIPNFNDSGEKELGCVSVIIVPESTEDRPTASPELTRIVERYLRNLTPVSVSSLTVTAPTYLGISVAADIYVTSMESASEVKFKAVKQLQDFLHPLYGGYDKKGWDFGKMPCNSDILAILQKLPEVDHVENLLITVNEEKSGTKFTVNKDVSLPAYTLISSDTHKIEIRSMEVSQNWG